MGRNKTGRNKTGAGKRGASRRGIGKGWTVAAVFLAVIALAVTGAAGAARARPLQIRIGYATAPSHVQPVIDALQKRHPELFPGFGKSYVAEGVHFRGSTPQIQALAINELEIAALAPSALALAVSNAGLDLRVVADVFQDGVPGYGSITYVVKKTGPIHTIADLKGKRLASNAIGSFGDSTMRIMLRKYGIADDQVTTVETSFASMPAMLEGGKVDLINLVPQFRHFITDGEFRVLFTGADAQGVSQAEFWVMRADFIKAHRPQLIAFFADHIRALRWLLDPAHHEEALRLAAAVTKEPPAALAYVFTHADEYRSPNARPNIAAIQRGIDNDVKLGVLPKRIVVAPKYVDLSLIAAAERRIAGK